MKGRYLSMISYKVYLTKSAEVAELIARGFDRPKGWIRTEYGAVSENLTSYIPSIYFNKGYFHATLQTKSDKEKYELVIC